MLELRLIVINTDDANDDDDDDDEWWVDVDETTNASNGIAI